MALTQNPPAGTGHIGYHTEIHQLLGEMDSYSNAAALGGVQAAHDALPAGGGVIWIPPNTTLTPTSAITITKPCAILGGRGAKIEHGGATNYHLLTVNGVDGFLIDGVILDGRYPTRTATGIQLYLNNSCSRVWVQNCQIINSAAGMANGTGLSQAWIINNRFYNSNGNGWGIQGVVSDLTFAGNHFDDFEHACLYFDNPGAGNVQTDVVIRDNRFRNTQRAGTAGKAAIQTYGAGSSSEEWHTRFKIVGNDISNSTATGDLVGIGLDQINDSLIAHNQVTNVPAGGPGPDTEGIVANGARNKICGNHIRYAEAGGIALLSYGGAGNLVKDTTVCCNTIEGNNAASGQGINWVATNAAGNAVTGLLIANNRVFRCGYGIQTYNNGGTLAGSNNFVVGNNLTGNVNGATNFVAGSGQTLDANLT